MSNWDPLDFRVRSSDWSVSGEPKVTAAGPRSFVSLPLKPKPVDDPLAFSPETLRGLDPNYQPMGGSIDPTFQKAGGSIQSRLPASDPFAFLKPVENIPFVGGFLRDAGENLRSNFQQLADIPKTIALTDYGDQFSRLIPQFLQSPAQRAAAERGRLAAPMPSPEDPNSGLFSAALGAGLGGGLNAGRFGRPATPPIALPAGQRPLALPARIPERPAPTVGFPPKPVEAPPIAAQPPFLKTLGLPETKMLHPGPEGLADLQRRYGTYAASRAFEKNPIGATDLAPKREPIQFPARAVTGEPTGLGAPTAAERAIESNGGRSAATDRTVAQIQRDTATRRLAVLPQGVSDASLAKFRDDVAAAEQRRQTLETPNYQKPLMADARARVEAKRNPSQVPITSAQLSQQLEDSLRARGVEPKGIPNENISPLPAGRGQPATGLGGLVRGEGGEARVDLGLSDLFKGRTNPAAEAQIREARANRMGELGPVGFLRDEGGSAKVGLGLGGRDPLKVARQDLLAGKITRAEYDRRVGPEQASAPLFSKKVGSGSGGLPSASVKRGANPMNQAPSGVAGGGPQLPSAPPGRPPINFSRVAENVTGATKTLSTAMSPFHFMFRHALPVISHPIAWAKGSARGLGEGMLKSGPELDARIQAMERNLEKNGYGDVVVQRPHSGIIGGSESVASNWVNRVPVLGEIIKRSGQGFVMGLNEVRYELTKSANDFALGMAKKGLMEPLTPLDKMRMADTINVYTGHPINVRNLGSGGKAAMRYANMTMFSPQMTVGRVKMLGYTVKGMGDVLNNLRQGRPIDPVAFERARLGMGAMIGMGGLYALSQSIFGGKTETNPVKTTFGQTDIGAPGPAQGLAALASSELGIGTSAYPGQDVMLNPTESEAALIRTAARFAVAIYDVAKGEKNLMRLEGAKQETSPMDVASRYAISQLFSSPITYPLAQFLQGYSVNPLGPITPMPVEAGLTGAGVQPPELGGRPATPSPTPKPAKTAKPTKLPMVGATPTPPTPPQSSSRPQQEGTTDTQGLLGRDSGLAYTPGSDLLKRLLPQLPAAFQQFVNEKFTRPNAQRLENSSPGAAGTYEIRGGNSAIAASRAYGSNSGLTESAIAEHELTHALAYEHPAFAPDARQHFQRLVQAYRASRDQLAPELTDESGADKLAAQDPAHLFTTLASLYVHGEQLPPALQRYFAPMGRPVQAQSGGNGTST